MTTRSTRCWWTSCRISVVVPSSSSGGPPFCDGAAVVVDEADDVEPVAAVLAHLLGEQARDVARADDEDVLHVRGLASADHADEDAEEPDEADRERPEHHEPLERRMGELDDVRADEEDPGSDRDDLEDAEEVVDGRVIGALLVAVVQPVQRARESPRAGRLAQNRTSSHCGTTVSTGVGRRNDSLRDDERGHEPDDVREEQQSTHEPAAARAPGRLPQWRRSRQMPLRPQVRQHSRSPPPNYCLPPTRLTRERLAVDVPFPRSSRYSEGGGPPTSFEGSSLLS